MAQETLIEKITTAYDDHVDTINSIMHDSIEPGLITEVEAACDNFHSKLKEFNSNENEVDEFIGKLDDLEFNEEQLERLYGVLVNHDDFEASDALENLDESDVADWLATKGYICVKLQTMDHVSKLKDFIESEIYPSVNDQADFLKY